MNEGPAFIPEAIDEISPEWLTQALNSRGHLAADGRVSKVEVSTIGDVEGFMGVVARLRLEFDGSPDGEAGAAPRSLIAKLPTRSPENRVLGEMLGAYWREIHFYEELASEMPVRVPRLYYAALTPDPTREKLDGIVKVIDHLPGWLLASMSGMSSWLVKRNAHRYVLLIEDLAPARVGDQVSGGSPETCEPVLRAAARLHARFWKKTDAHQAFWLMRQNQGTRMRQRLFRTAAPRFRERYPALMANGGGRLIDWLEQNGMKLSRALHNDPPATLLHCDLRFDNIFLDDTRPDDPVILADWQLVGVGAAAYDVAYLLSGALTTEIGEREERALLGSYHDALCANGVVDYPFDALLRDYKRSLFAVLQVLSTTDQVEMGAERAVTLMDLWVERTFRRLRDVRLDSLL